MDKGNTNKNVRFRVERMEKEGELGSRQGVR